MRLTGGSTDHEAMGEVSKSAVFSEVADLLFGDGAGDLIAKANPDGADISRSDRKKQKRQAQVGLASNVLGIAAGASGLAAASRDERFKEGGKLSRKFYRAGERIPRPISSKAGKAGAALAGGALALQVGNLAGDAVANRVLAREAKKKVSKRGGALKAVGAAGLFTGGGAVGAGVGYENRKTTKEKRAKLLRKVQSGELTVSSVPTTKGQLVKAGSNKVESKVREKVGKSADLDGPAIEISKVNTDKQQVFGWASVVEKNGEPVVDLQGDFIPVEEMEKAGYAYVRKSRKAGDMHQRDGDQAKVVGEMIESFVVTKDKKDALGLPEDMPIGWWVGFQIEDPQVWSEIKNGKRTGFSVHGTGKREAFDA